jgi:hypothetical protein
VPLVEELVLVLRQRIGDRTGGPVFLRQRFDTRCSLLVAAASEELKRAVSRRIEATEAKGGGPLSRQQEAKLARSMWREAGALRAEAIRQSFSRTARSAGLAEATCPKSWRHTFATLPQDANVDSLIRQITLGHAPTGVTKGALGMTSVYTHTGPETQKREIQRALRLFAAAVPAIHSLCGHLSGVAATCLYDNMKVAVARYKDDEPIYNTRFLAFATHYGLRPVACRRRRPQTKGRVERPFYFVETNLLSGREFRSLDRLNEVTGWPCVFWRGCSPRNAAAGTRPRRCWPCWEPIAARISWPRWIAPSATGRSR